MVKDNYILGVLLGLALPFLGFAIFYQWKFSMFSVPEFLELLNQQKSILSGMISVSLLLRKYHGTELGHINKQLTFPI